MVTACRRTRRSAAPASRRGEPTSLNASRPSGETGENRRPASGRGLTRGGGDRWTHDARLEIGDVVLEFHDSGLLPSQRESRRVFGIAPNVAAQGLELSEDRLGNRLIRVRIGRCRSGRDQGAGVVREWPSTRLRALTLGMAVGMGLGRHSEYAIRSRSTCSQASASKRRSASSWVKDALHSFSWRSAWASSRRSVSLSSASFSSRARSRLRALSRRRCGRRPLSSESLERVQAFQYAFAQPIAGSGSARREPSEPRPAKTWTRGPAVSFPACEVHPPCKSFRRNVRDRDRDHADSGDSASLAGPAHRGMVSRSRSWNSLIAGRSGSIIATGD